MSVSGRHSAFYLVFGHDLTAARARGIIQPCLIRQILIQGVGTTVRTPYYGHRELPAHYQQYNRDHVRLRAPGEHGFARLKAWRLLRRARCSTSRIGRTVTALHAVPICENTG